MQFDVRGFSIGGDFINSSLVVITGHMEQINILLTTKLRQIIHPRNKRRNTDTRTNPYLVCEGIIEIEATIGTFYGDRHANI